MKNMFKIVLAVIWLTQISAQPTRLIVRGDDMGAAHAINNAIITAAEKGIQTSIEVMVPGPWYPEAIKLLKERKYLDVGVHLTLTSEWENMKYRPLTHAKTLVDKNGYFLPFVYPNKNYPGLSILENGYSLEEIELEFRAQIERAKNDIFNLSHITCHMGCSSFDPKVKDLVKSLADEYGLNIHPDDYKVKDINYEGPKKTPKEKIASFNNVLKSLKKGETYLFVDHPGYDDEELKSLHHIGYEDVALDRSGVLKAWTHNKIKKTIKDLNIQLISYGDLPGKRIQLFNGKDHEGWYTDVPALDSNPKGSNPFIIRDGKMVSLAHTGGHIITNKEYENYRLNIDYRFPAKPGNCGVLVHVSKPRRLYGMFPQSIEVQMMHENAGDFWCIGEDISVDDMESRRGPKEKWGVDEDKNRRIINLIDNAEKPLGQWNHMQIDCIGREIKVWVNGKLVNHGYNATASRGKIALQAEGAEVEFRNVTLTQFGK